MSKQYDVLGFGEAMVRFSPLNNARLEQSGALTLAIAAAELNVAVNTSRLGLKTAWVSKMVDTWSGQYVINKGREHGVDMSMVKLAKYDGVGRERNGLCFVEIGVGPRPNRQIYDRGHSAISMAKPEEFDWKGILEKTGWYHTTGISTAISDLVIENVIISLKTAKELGVTTSFDLNFRSTMWTPEKAQEVMKKVLPYVDVLIGNEEDFEKMLGIKANVGKGYSKIDPLSYQSVAEKAMEEYPNISVVGTTLRDAKTGLLNDWQTVMLYKGKFYQSRKYEDLEIVDRTGGGDSFASGLIYGMIEGKEPQYIIDFSAAYSALCHGFLGDWNWAYKEEAERVMKGESVRVLR
ncbi:2-dehydro-3-deoxygluconokinase [Betaproteobacteria bacterium]|nr:2-dehydro-3-deoxygluconokinase [Betaproteobacteria bacterium]